MPIYLYKGYDAKTGAASKGKIEADSIKQAKQILRSQKKIIPAELKEELSASTSSFNIFSKKTVDLVDISIMTRQFATLQSAHVPLDECLKALTEQVESLVLRNTLSSLREGISEGKSLGDSMARFPHIFNNLYVNMVRAGEASGKLGLVLKRLADFIEYQVAIKAKVSSAMTSPLVMLSISFVVIGFLFTNVIPELKKIFDSEKQALPWYTEMIMNLSDFIVNQWYIVMGALILILSGFQAWYKSAKGRLIFDRFCLKAPLVSGIVIRVNISKFTKTLSTLLNSGVPIMLALEITKNVISNKVLANTIAQAKLAVQEGKTLASVLSKNEFFPPLVSHMIKTGEKTGELEPMLEHVAKAYDAEVERKIDSMIALIGPAMVVTLSSIVVTVVIAVMVPLFDMMDKLGQ